LQPSLKEFSEKKSTTRRLKTTGFVGEFLLANVMNTVPDRIDRDAITPTRDFIICPHPGSKNLFLATSGSFHVWKFLPILGKYVVEMLEGMLSDEMAERWAWDKHDQGSAHKSLVPHREMRDFL
jgi:glycine/D-amino acid oxidase-like deaminating enzyme